jgi:hypothetical protein
VSLARKINAGWVAVTAELPVRSACIDDTVRIYGGKDEKGDEAEWKMLSVKGPPRS